MVDLIDETFIVAEPAAVAARVHDAAELVRWWPDLELTVFEDRGDAGARWTVTGALVGTAEIWLEPVGDGTVMHVFIRADQTRQGSATVVVAGSATRLARAAQRENQARAREVKRWAWALKDVLEGGRRPGEPRRDATRGVATDGMNTDRVNTDEEVTGVATGALAAPDVESAGHAGVSAPVVGTSATQTDSTAMNTLRRVRT